VGNEPNVVDWLTLAVAAVGASLTTFTSIWIARQNQREKFHLHIDWVWEGGAPVAEYAVLYVQNRSTTALQIAEIAWYRGLFRRRKASGTAKWWDDPSDLNFPYEVKAGETKSFALEEDGAQKQLAKVTPWERRLAKVRKATFWVGVTTVAGKRKFVAADPALPWTMRPNWLRTDDD